MAMPAATAEPRPSVAQVQKAVNKLQKQVDQASEDYDTTREQLKSVNIRLKAAGTKLTHQQKQVAKAKWQVGVVAAQAYRQGQMSTLDLMLSNNPDAALAQAGFLPSFGQRQQEALSQLKQGEQDLLNTQTLMQQQRTTAQAAQDKMAANKKAVQKKLDQVQAELSKIQVSKRQYVLSAGSGNVASSADTGSCSAHASGAPSAAAKAAIQYACGHLGDNYVWAADGPTTFDCSGLTMKAYAAGGISLPHSSKMQSTYGTSVSISSLEPGDLVFFHSPISHVGLYLGNGLMVHAPETGDVVKVASLFSTPTAAVRLG
jgi:cell wall-associated NlpC family hydrolase